MTDDKAPVELLGMQVIDELIRDEVAPASVFTKSPALFIFFWNKSMISFDTQWDSVTVSAFRGVLDAL